jgi:hypothetical protein
VAAKVAAQSVVLDQPVMQPQVQVAMAQPMQPQMQPQMQTIGVAVPQGVGPGMPFVVAVNGQHVQVTCPQGVGPGQMIQLQVPVVNLCSWAQPMNSGPSTMASAQIVPLHGPGAIFPTPGSGQWSTGLFDICADAEIFLYGCCCSYCASGSVSGKRGSRTILPRGAFVTSPTRPSVWPPSCVQTAPPFVHCQGRHHRPNRFLRLHTVRFPDNTASTTTLRCTDQGAARGRRLLRLLLLALGHRQLLRPLLLLSPDGAALGHAKHVGAARVAVLHVPVRPPVQRLLCVDMLRQLRPGLWRRRRRRASITQPPGRSLTTSCASCAQVEKARGHSLSTHTAVRHLSPGGAKSFRVF